MTLVTTATAPSHISVYAAFNTDPLIAALFFTTLRLREVKLLPGIHT